MTIQSLIPEITKYAELGGFTPDEIKIILARASDPAYADGLNYMLDLALRNVKFSEMKAPWTGEDRLNNLVLLLGAMIKTEKYYTEKGWMDHFGGVPRDVKVWCNHSVENDNIFGIEDHFLEWLHAGLNGRVIRFGRLQCNPPSPSYLPFDVYRSRTTGKLCALLDAEWFFDQNGLYCADAGDSAFRTAKVIRGGKTCTGYAAERGRVFREPVTLDLNEWKLVHKEGDLTVNVHIPADGPVLLDDALEALGEMEKFWRKEGQNPVAFICESWMLDPSFQEIMPPRYNVRRFSELADVLLPFEGESDAVARVCGTHYEKVSPDLYPQRSSMQRLFADFVRRGGKFRSGAFIRFI